MSFVNVTISNCTTNKTFGGAIYANLNSNVNAVNLRISGCSALYGGAVAVRQNSVFNCINCSFDGNSATSDGGAIYVADSNSYCENCVFSSLSATVGGAFAMTESASVVWKGGSCSKMDYQFFNAACAYVGSSSSLKISNVTMSGITGNFDGLALYVELQASVVATNLIIQGLTQNQYVLVVDSGSSFLCDSCLVNQCADVAFVSFASTFSLTNSQLIASSTFNVINSDLTLFENQISYFNDSLITSSLQSTILIWSNTFANGLMNNGEALLSLSSSSIYLKNTSFTNVTFSNYLIQSDNTKIELDSTTIGNTVGPLVNVVGGSITMQNGNTVKCSAVSGPAFQIQNANVVVSGALNVQNCGSLPINISVSDSNSVDFRAASSSSSVGGSILIQPNTVARKVVQSNSYFSTLLTSAPMFIIQGLTSTVLSGTLLPVFNVTFSDAFGNPVANNGTADISFSASLPATLTGNTSYTMNLYSILTVSNMQIINANSGFDLIMNGSISATYPTVSFAFSGANSLFEISLLQLAIPIVVSLFMI